MRNRSVLVIRILPFCHDAGWESEVHLMASGALKSPEETMDWEQFFRAPAGEVPQELTVEVALAERGDR